VYVTFLDFFGSPARGTGGHIAAKLIPNWLQHLILIPICREISKCSPK